MDIDRDGDFDLFTGGNDNIQFAENSGTSEEAAFTSIENNPYGISMVGLGQVNPVFIDIDGDGDFDLFSGSTPGTILFQENVGNASSASFASMESAPINLGVQTTI